MQVEHSQDDEEYVQTKTLKDEDRTRLLYFSFQGRVQSVSDKDVYLYNVHQKLHGLTRILKLPSTFVPMFGAFKHFFQAPKTIWNSRKSNFKLTKRSSLTRVKNRRKDDRKKPQSSIKRSRKQHHRRNLSQQTILLLLILHEVTLSSVASLRPGLLCNKIDGLAPSQRRMCQARPDLMPLIAKGVHRAWYECQWQFRNNKWNCTHNGTKFFAVPELAIATKESAFEYAIKSAGILYEIVKACGEGRLGASCGCAKHDVSFQRSKRRTQVSPSQVDRGMYQRWRWGGCSVDLGFGLNYTREFVDGREIQRTTRSLMNRHNLEAGRLAITKNLTKSCRCHGVSGSCNVRTCWIALPSFRQVGNNLRQKFVSARRVDAILGGKRRRPHILKIRNKARKPSPRELVFLDTSPEFCERDRRTGIFGTSGRQCNGSAQNYSGCDSLCCHRGYRTAEYDKQEPCRCKFFWCCTVTCQKCIRKVKTYTCN